MAAIDMTGNLRRWVETAVNDACLGEDFAWDVRWDIQTPNLTYTVVVGISNPMLGKGPVMQTFQVGVMSLREDAVREGVHELMSMLRATRRKLLAAAAKPHRDAGN